MVSDEIIMIKFDNNNLTKTGCEHWVQLNVGQKTGITLRIMVLKQNVKVLSPDNVKITSLKGWAWEEGRREKWADCASMWIYKAEGQNI